MQEVLTMVPWLLPVLYGGMAIAFFCAVLRLIIGPDLPDRVVALDLALAIVLCVAAVYAAETGHQHFLDVALAIGVIAFISTVALARFLERGAMEEQ